MSAGLAGWLSDPPDDRGIRVTAGPDDWSYHPYPELARDSRRVAARLRSDGIRTGDVVAVLHGNGPEFVSAFFGTLLAGAVPAPLAVPATGRDAGEQRTRLARTCAAAGVRAVLTTPALADAVPGVPPVTDAAAHGDEHDGPAPSSGVAFVQFTSGSTGTPRPIRVPHDAVVANIEAFHTWLEVDPASDEMATWLPLHHDMGLVGCLLAPMMLGISIRLMEPQDFVRSPARWLDCFGRGGSTIGASPTFGLAQVLRRVRPAALEGMDLSRWKALIIGAERVDVDVLLRLADRLAVAGLRPSTLLPAYGLAEATLAVTGQGLRGSLRTVTLDSASLAPGRPVVGAPPGTPGSTTLVGCGAPLPGVGVRVVDPDGTAVPDATVGEVEVRGDSVADGSPAPDGSGAVLRTGDAGFLLDGDLYVLGRIGDGVKSLGRWLFAEVVEELVAGTVDGGRPVVLLGGLAGRDTVAVLLERNRADRAPEVGRAVLGTWSDLRVLVVAVAPGEIRRTTSGKPRRRLMWTTLADGGFEEHTVWDSARRPEPVR